MEEIKKASYELLLKNRRLVDGHQFTVPSPGTYPYQWFWDSCFHAIVLSHFNTQEAKKELLSLIAGQLEDGMIPHMIYWKKIPGVHDVDWGREKTSSITQPPLIAYAAWEIYQKDKDKTFLKNIYPSLSRYYRYLLTQRTDHDLIGIIDPDESGEDNSPRFDEPLGLLPSSTLEENARKRQELNKKARGYDFAVSLCKKNFWVADVPFNVICIKNLRAMADIAHVLQIKHDPDAFQSEQVKIAKAMREKMLEDGIFWPVYGEDEKKLKVKTWAMFAPLFCKMLSREEADMLVNNHLLNPNEFWTRFSVPTASKSEPSFHPAGFWRGPTWIAINWFLFHGLMQYGHQKIAEHIRNQSIELIKKSGFREYFHPETGEGYGAKDFTWGTLVVDMVPEVGVEPTIP